MQCSSETLNDALINDLARCVADCEMDTLELVYFLGQCGHESAGLRYPVEIHDGSNYEGRTDLGNTQPGDGVKFAGTGWIQVTGRYNHQSFADAIGDPKVMELGKTYTSEKYPWSISAFWWKQNNMKALCQQHKACNDADIDAIGARVNGRMRPNGADDRISFTDRAYRTLIGV
jgi:predicted chitinase